MIKLQLWLKKNTLLKEVQMKSADIFTWAPSIVSFKQKPHVQN